MFNIFKVYKRKWEMILSYLIKNEMFRMTIGINIGVVYV